MDLQAAMRSLEEVAREQERERCAKLAADCAAERLRMPCGGLSADWMDGFEAACEFVTVAIRNQRS